MGRSKSISATTAAQIVAYRDTGMSQVAIATRLGLAQSIVCRTLQRHSSTGSFAARSQPGRPRKSTKQTDRLIKRIVVADPTASSSFIATQLPSTAPLSTRTIRRRLQVDGGLRSYRAAPKPMLSRKNIADRLAFAKKYQNWTSEDWRKVLFSDECAVRQFQNYKSTVRRPAGERFNPRYVSPTTKHSPSIMIWGCISGQGRGPLWFTPRNTTITGPVYQGILQEKLLEWMERRQCQYFQHDGAPCHRAKIVSNWLALHQIEVTGPWPGNSPDLNAIENCWQVVEKKVAAHKSTSLDDLQQKIKLVWCTEISIEYCQKLVDSMPQRLAAVIANKGGPTKY